MKEKISQSDISTSLVRPEEQPKSLETVKTVFALAKILVSTDAASVADPTEQAELQESASQHAIKIVTSSDEDVHRAHMVVSALKEDVADKVRAYLAQTLVTLSETSSTDH